VTELSFPYRSAQTQSFTLGAPRAITVVGSDVLFLRSADGTTKEHGLYRHRDGVTTLLVDPASGDGGRALSATELAMRERARTRTAGIVGYAVDKAGTIAAFTIDGQLFVYDLAAERLRPTDVRGAFDARPNADGTRVAYVLDGELHLLAVADLTSTKLIGRTEDEGDLITYGLAEFIAAEEMDRHQGYWWSADGSQLIVERADSTAVPTWHISDPAHPEQAPTSVAYPAAGTVNATVTLWICDVVAGSGKQIEFDNVAYPYVTNVHWSKGGDPLVSVQTRDQKTVLVLGIDPASGKAFTVHTETDDTWVDIFPGVPAWTESGDLVRIGVNDERNSLFVGNRVVSGDLNVRAVQAVADAGVVFTASGNDSTQIHVYNAAATGELTPISTIDGVHAAVVGGDLTVLTSVSLAQHGSTTTILRAGKPLGTLENLRADAVLTPKVTLHEVAERGLRTAVVFPTGHVPGSGKLPVLVDPYGGPHAQQVLQSQALFALRQWIADLGFIVVTTDGRGTPGRGPAWDRAIWQDFADATLTDQIDALHAVADTYPDLDLTRVAIRGWSYGGYLSALAVLRRPDVFHAAISGAPVTQWRLYDTHYTERYLGHPDEYPDVYEENSLVKDADSLTAKLLLIHGLADDNVFAAHTLQLSSALLAAGQAHDVLPLTSVTHMGFSAPEKAEHFLGFQMDWLRRNLG
jgi:dipeptidyl-peptidase-4